MIEFFNKIEDFKIKQIILDNFEFDFVSNEFNKLITFKINNEIIGLLIFSQIYDRLEVDYILVLENFRNKKIASKMMEYLCIFMKENKFLNISLEVKINNEAAINLYKKFDFKIVSIREKYYNGVNAYLMVRVGD